MKWIALAAAAVALACAAFFVLTRTGSGRTLSAGDAAPEFELPGSDGKRWRLSDFRGRQAVVLAWFPKAFTGG